MMTNVRFPCQVILPIRVGLDPMERLLVASFKGDSEFEGFEPQVFDDAVNGKGMRVLRYRKDGRVDIYWQPGVRVDRSTFTVGAGIGDFAETIIEPAHFEITERSLNLHVAFTDVQGRKVELRVQEDTHGKRGFPLLAPVGADIEKPLQLFLVYMPDIDLVRRAVTLVEARIGDRILRPASLPILLNWHRVWFVRYAASPVIGILNPPMSRPLIVELAVPGSVEVEGMLIVADAEGSVTRISAGQEPYQVEVDFLPGFPNLLEFPNGGSASGQWSIRIAGVPITGGAYRVSREGDRVAVELDVTEPWKPSGLPLSMERYSHVWYACSALGRLPTDGGVSSNSG